MNGLRIRGRTADRQITNHFITMNDKQVKEFLQSENGMRNAERFIKALKEHRIVCSVKHVSSTGMSRTISFCEMHVGTMNRKKYGQILQFNWFISQLGYTYDKNRDGIRVGGCGMDMVFNTLYNVAAELKRNGFKVPNDYASLADHYNYL